MFAFALLVLTLNALTTFVGEAVLAHGWAGALLNLFDVSAVIWVGIAGGTALAWSSAFATTPSRSDALWLGAAAVAALVPVPVASSVMLSLLAGWGWWSSTARSPLRRASAIFFSLTAFLLWGRMLLAWGSGPLLAGDAQFVALLAGTQSAGNGVSFADGTRFVIAPGCSSLHGVSLALILWTTVVQYFAIAPGRRAVLTLGSAIIGSIAVNGLRLAVIAWNPQDFAWWHLGTGGALFGWLALIVIAGIIFWGLGHARRMA